MNSKRPSPTVRPSPTLPEDIAALVEALVEQNETFCGAEGWARYEESKRILSECCGPLATPTFDQSIFQRALHAYMMGVCL